MATVTSTLLDQIYHLPVKERMLIVERTIHSIRTGKNAQGAFTESDTVQSHYASEQVLAKDWLNEKENAAWENL